MNLPTRSRRSFLKTTSSLATIASFANVVRSPRTSQAARGLVAYVGTFSSPLRDTLPTQVDLPPGNGRGIHLFQVDRSTGALAPRGVYESGMSPNCLAINAAGSRMYATNETDHVGDEKEGTVSAFAVDSHNGQLRLLNTV